MKFEEIKVWQRSKVLFKEMNNIFNSTKFKDYFFKDQILRATLSVSNNIAE
jgi:four helix bundle protein